MLDVSSAWGSELRVKLANERHASLHPVRFTVLLTHRKLHRQHEVGAMALHERTHTTPREHMCGRHNNYRTPNTAHVPS